MELQCTNLTRVAGGLLELAVPRLMIFHESSFLLFHAPNMAYFGTRFGTKIDNLHRIEA